MCNNAGEDCMFCGEVTGAVGAGEWTKVCCEVWAYGSKLRLENSRFPLTVCEVEAYGPYESELRVIEGFQSGFGPPM